MNIFDYRWWWSKIGGRPWTFILRDLYHKFEFVWIVGLVSLGIVLGHHYDWDSILKMWLAFSLGYLGGHLFWGREYIPDERGDSGYSTLKRTTQNNKKSV
mgnify:CR=1 FL=1